MLQVLVYTSTYLSLSAFRVDDKFHWLRCRYKGLLIVKQDFHTSKGILCENNS